MGTSRTVGLHMIVAGLSRLAEQLNRTHFCFHKMAVSRIVFLSIERHMLMATCIVATATPAASTAASAAKSSHNVIESAARSRRTKAVIASHTDLNFRIEKQFKRRKRCMERFSSLATEYFCRSHHCHRRAESIVSYCRSRG